MIARLANHASLINPFDPVDKQAQVRRLVQRVAEQVSPGK